MDSRSHDKKQNIDFRVNSACISDIEIDWCTLCGISVIIAYGLLPSILLHLRSVIFFHFICAEYLVWYGYQRWLVIKIKDLGNHKDIKLWVNKFTYLTRDWQFSWDQGRVISSCYQFNACVNSKIADDPAKFWNFKHGINTLIYYLPPPI